MLRSDEKANFINSSSLTALTAAWLAQLVERRTVVREVEGSGRTLRVLKQLLPL